MTKVIKEKEGRWTKWKSVHMEESGEGEKEKEEKVKERQEVPEGQKDRQRQPSR